MARRTPRLWTPEEDEKLKEAHAAGGTVASISRDLDRDTTTVIRHATMLGLDWNDRVYPSTVNVARARMALDQDVKERRQKLKSDLMTSAQQLHDQLFARTTVFNFGGKENTYEQHEIDEPTHADKLKIMQGINTALNSVERIERLQAETDTSGTISMLDGISRAVAAAADQLRNRSVDDELQELL